jgi:septum formation protein
MNGKIISKDIRLILASGSPRRRELLESLGIRFEVIPSDVDESFLPLETPHEGVMRLALEKAGEVSQAFRNYWTLGADTVVVIEGKILGKPLDKEEAALMLGSLTGRTHEVYTGYALLNSACMDLAVSGYSRSEVFIRDLSSGEIQEYVETGEPLDKAGAYAIQGLGAAIVQRINGSYTNVVGLPLCEVARELKRLQIYDFLKARKQ